MKLWTATALATTLLFACKKPLKCTDLDRDDTLRLGQEYNAGRDPCPGLTAPKLTLNAAGLSLDGVRLAGKPELPAGAVRRVDALFTQLKARRESWKQMHAGANFAAKLDADIADGVDAVAAASVLQTAAYAGFPTVHVHGGATPLDIVLYVPGPPKPGAPPATKLHVDDVAGVASAIAAQCTPRCDAVFIQPRGTFGDTARVVSAVLSASPFAGNAPWIALW